MKSKNSYSSKVRHSFKKLHSQLKKVTLKYSNEILFSELPEEKDKLASKAVKKYQQDEELLLKLRDAFYYRQDSVLYHFNILLKIQNNSDGKVNSNLDSRVLESLLNASAYQQKFLFDDLLFNLISLFDYFGNYVGYIYEREHGKKKGWNSLYKACQHKNPSADKIRKKLFNSRVAKLVIKNHRSWIDNLYGYRSTIIHDEIDEIDASLTYSIPIEGKGSEKNSELEVLVPKNFAKNLKLEHLDEDLSLIEATYLVLTKSSKTLISLFEALDKDINSLSKNG